MLAEDCTDAFNLVLYDRAAKRLIGKTATKLIAEGYEVCPIYERTFIVRYMCVKFCIAIKNSGHMNNDLLQDPATYPPFIKNLIGKEITVKIELNDDNILLNITVFYAIDAYDTDYATSSRSANTSTATTNSNFGDVSTVITNAFHVNTIPNCYLIHHFIFSRLM